MNAESKPNSDSPIDQTEVKRQFFFELLSYGLPKEGNIELPGIARYPIRALDYALATGAILFTVLMFAIVCIQIVTRVTPLDSPTWTEEAARYCFIYMVSFASALGIREKAYIGFDALLRLLPKRVRAIFSAVIYLLVFCLMGVLFWYAFKFVKIGGYRTSATLPIRMSWVHGSMLIMGGSCAIYALIGVVASLLSIFDQKDSQDAQQDKEQDRPQDEQAEGQS